MELQQRSLLVGEDVFPLKPLGDPRLNKALNISEFIKAFTIYKNILCASFPERETEMSAYLADIVDMASRYPGLTFYEYHRELSAKAASWHLKGISVDWSKRDTKLFTALFSGIKANACNICSSLTHYTGFCPLAPGNKSEARGKRQEHSRSSGMTHLYNGKEVCNNYNLPRGCSYAGCKCGHICIECQAFHPRFECTVFKSSSNQRAQGNGQAK